MLRSMSSHYYTCETFHQIGLISSAYYNLGVLMQDPMSIYERNITTFSFFLSRVQACHENIIQQFNAFCSSCWVFFVVYSFW